MSNNNSSGDIHKVVGVFALILVVLDCGWAAFMGWLVGSVFGAPTGDVTAVTQDGFVVGVMAGGLQSIFADCWLIVFGLVALITSELKKQHSL